jgi:anti-anti-sigma regulatory factor
MYEFKLPSSLTISNCDEIINSAIEVKANNEKIELNSSEVEILDTAGIQLIWSFCMDEGQVTHSNISEKVSEVMSGLGLIS